MGLAFLMPPNGERRQGGARLGYRYAWHGVTRPVSPLPAMPAVLIITVALCLMLGSREARACDCIGPHEPFEELISSNQVFEAEIMDDLPAHARKGGTFKDGDCGWQVKMLRSWKGTTSDRDDPVYDDCWCSAGKLERGKSYIFYARQTRSGLRQVDRCSRVVPTDDASRDREELGTPLSVRAPDRPWQPTALAKPPPTPPLRRWRPSRLATCAVLSPGAGHDQTPGAWLFFLLAVSFARAHRRVATAVSFLCALCLLASCKTVLEVPCTNDAECGAHGACKDGWCYESAAYCRDRTECKSEGQCTLADGECVVRNDDDCRKSSACRSKSQCTAEQDQCIVASNRDCQRGHQCESSGACTFKGGKCLVGSSADCRRSGPCKQWGACQLVKGRCKSESSADCEQSQRCKRDGMCSYRAGVCTATTIEHCAQSERCKTYGACLLRGGHCIRSCAKSTLCTRRGLCQDDGSACVAPK